MRLRLICSSFLLLFMFPGCLLAQTTGENTFSSKGTLLKEQSKPIPNGNIILFHHSDSTLVHGTNADDSGRVELLAKPGEYFTRNAFSRPIVSVLGSKDQQEIKKRAVLYLEHLDIGANIHLTIIISRELPKTQLGLTISRPSKVAEIDQVIQVWIDAKLSKEKQLLVLAHEMIHVKQFAKKELVVQEDWIIWKGATFYNFGDYDRYMPWEEEAYYTDKKLAHLVPRTEDKNNIFEASCKFTSNTTACDNKDYVKTEPDTATKNLIACSKTP